MNIFYFPGGNELLQDAIFPESPEAGLEAPSGATSSTLAAALPKASYSGI